MEENSFANQTRREPTCGRTSTPPKADAHTLPKKPADEEVARLHLEKIGVQADDDL